MSAPVSQNPGTVVLVDGHALAYRSYFAISSLTTSKGESVQAIFGFLRQLLRLLRNDAQQVIVVFDAPAKTFRHEQFEGYKAGRAKTPEDLPGQINRIRKLVDLLGLQRFEMPGYEADDIIGTITRRAEAQGYQVRILTSDRDAYQLLDDQVRVINSAGELLGPAEIHEKYGVTVRQWVDFRALTGDASDNIPGAKGIGPKTAAKLLQDYGSLDAVLQEAQNGTLKPKGAQEKIAASIEDVKFSRELSCMVTDLDVDVQIGEKRGKIDLEPLLAELRDLEFNSLVRDVMGLLGDGDAPQATPEPEAPTLAPWQTPTEGVIWGYRLTREDDLQAELAEVATWDGEAARVLEQVELAEFVGQRSVNAINAKALATHLMVRGVNVLPGEDPMLMAYLIDSAVTTPQLACEKHLGHAWPDQAAGRAVAGGRLLDALQDKLDERRRILYDQVEKPLSSVLAKMEVHGIRIDSDYFRALSLSMGARIGNLESDIYGHAGREFPIGSRDQLEKVLYDELGLASSKKTKLTGKRSTAVGALEPLRDEHPIIPALLEYRELTKLKSTYLDAMTQLVNPHTGRLHTTFSQTSVATGRLSSLNPNLQNIPIRTETGREIRKGFVADSGYCLISADYSQLELRLLSHIADDPKMQQAFIDGADIHRRTASQVLGVSEELVQPQQRRAAKTVNFGVLYGMSAHRLSNDLKIPYAEAAGFIERYFATYPGIREYIDRTLAFCREHLYVETLMGRRRYVPEINASNKNVREAAERIAYNMPIQGTAADIMKLAMVRLEGQLAALGARLLVQVHDEILVEVPEGVAQDVEQLIRREMLEVYDLKVPLGVEVGVGPNWYDTK
ncbi:DNA polymerase I [Deinococcus peraridilitoris]|uniref:DNA polymerase I n=1 Tax=Deinococcus peraridilitoris (strain DSM 19664 / LMG 22246 / CIP 109416 / KR-200) TaxID=937777 RepID=L0A636_DEIPD|nr:DNA polymerase I [Deinococcus peraridilitoris]AFZ68607.1 DNA polymerase I [Deinococcus peraridilitoris DSM 19664]